MTDYFLKIKKIISEKAGVLPEEVKRDSYFEDDLNIGEMELVEILQELEELFQTDLIEHKDDIESVADLLDLLAEKLD